MTAVDLTAAADVLGRAADRLEKLTAAALGNFERNASTPWWTPEGLLDSGHDPEDADFIGRVSPHAVAALIDPLREAAEGITRAITHYGSEEAAYSCAAPDDVVLGLVEFARRVLREEETS